MRPTLEEMGRLLFGVAERWHEPEPTLEERVQAVEFRIDSLAARVEKIEHRVPAEDADK